MAKQKTFTQEQLEGAKQKLAELPDISQNKLSAKDVLDALKVQIVELCTKKGYTVSELKAVLADVGIQVTARELSEMTENRKGRVRAKPAQQ